MHAQRSHAELYAVNGRRLLPFTTLYQLAAAAGTPQPALARTLLLVPDLITHRRTGTVAAEVTNASTTGQLDVHTRTLRALVRSTQALRRFEPCP